jgi:isopropylmalate/homocitrate/citramalate synthase
MQSMAEPSRADALRRHREAFEYAREHNLTLRDAEKAIAAERSRLARERLAAVQRCGRCAAAPPAALGADQPARPIPENAPWMMRD